MTTPVNPGQHDLRVVVGYDGSVAAGAAIGAAAALLPGAQAWIAVLWTPPFASVELRRRLWTGSRDVNAFVEAIEREGEAEAERLAALGVVLATAAGWTAEPVVQRAYGGEGLQFTALAEKTGADLVVVGSRGLTGTRALLGSVSDMAVHYTPEPVMVVPHPMLQGEHDALAAGPVIIGWDGSAGARRALTAAVRLFPARELIATSVSGDGEAIAGPTGFVAGSGRPVSHESVERGHGPSGRAVAQALSGNARRHGAAAIVVGSRGRAAVEEIVLGSAAIATLHHAFRVVTVVPAAGR